MVTSRKISKFVLLCILSWAFVTRVCADSASRHDYRPLPSYDVIHPEVKTAMDSLLNMGRVDDDTKNNSIRYVGEIFFFKGKVSLLSLILNQNKASNYPSGKVDNVVGVVDYQSALWFIYSRLPVSNIFQSTGLDIPNCYCEQLIVEKTDTTVNPCSYEYMDDVLYGVDLIFDNQCVDGDTLAVNIRRLTAENIESTTNKSSFKFLKEHYKP